MRTRRTKEQIRKDNYNKDVDAYNFYVVNLDTKRAETGFEFKEDAVDLLNDYDDKKKYKVVSKRALKSMGIENPNESFKYEGGGNFQSGFYANGGEIRKFDRHSQMDSETREEILDVVSEPELSGYLTNCVYGLFDGYDYSQTDNFKKDLNKLKSKDSKLYNRVVDIYKKIDTYKFEKRNEYAKGGSLIGNQKRIDLNKNGKIDAEDFKLLRTTMNGGWRKDHKHVNSTSRKDGKLQDYEVRYARKNKSDRTGYKGKTNFADGGGVEEKKYHLVIVQGDQLIYLKMYDNPDDRKDYGDKIQSILMDISNYGDMDVVLYETSKNINTQEKFYDYWKQKSEGNITDEEVSLFVDYVDGFYGKQGIYSNDLNGGFTKSEIKKAVDKYISSLNEKTTWGGGDSLDRERVRQILDPSYKMFADGGGVDRFSEYSNDALTDMIINLSRYENTESDIQMVKDELKKRKGENLFVEEEVTYFLNKDGIKVRSKVEPKEKLSEREWAEKHNPRAYEYMGKRKMATGGGVQKGKKGDIGKSGTQYGYTLKEWEDMAEKNGLLVSPNQWWKSQNGKKYVDNFGRNKTIGQHSGDKQHEMNKYGYLIANGMDLGSKIIPLSAKNYVEENNFSKYENGGALIGNQKRIDMNKNGKIDAEDFKLLRSSMNGAWRNERKHVNHNEDYEVRYAKPRPKRTGYKGKRNFEGGGKMQKAETGTEVKKGVKGGIMTLAKKIRKEGESWQDAVKRAGQQLK